MTALPLCTHPPVNQKTAPESGAGFVKNEETLFLRKQEICGKLQISVFLKKVLYNFSVLKYNADNRDRNRGANGAGSRQKLKVNSRVPRAEREELIMKKIIAVLLIAMLLLAGCGKKTDATSDLTYVQEKGTLIIGITDYAPMDYKDDSGEWTGFDAEFGRLIGEKLGVKVEFFELADWDSKFLELDAKNIDCIWNGMTITDEVLKNTACSNPYVKNAQVVVMDKTKAGDYPDADSIKGLKFAVEKSSAGALALDDLGITGYVETSDQAGALMEVKAGTADACVIDITMADAMTGAGTSYENLGGVLELTSEEYGVGFRKDSDLATKFNELMAEMMKDGTLDALAAKYELTLVK